MAMHLSGIDRYHGVPSADTQPLFCGYNASDVQIYDFFCNFPPFPATKRPFRLQQLKILCISGFRSTKS